MDMQATTPVDPRVLDSMLPHYTQQFGNPHSRTHFYGWENEDAVEDAREVRHDAHLKPVRGPKKVFLIFEIVDFIFKNSQQR